MQHEVVLVPVRLVLFLCCVNASSFALHACISILIGLELIIMKKGDRGRGNKDTQASTKDLTSHWWWTWIGGQELAGIWHFLFSLESARSLARSYVAALFASHFLPFMGTSVTTACLCFSSSLVTLCCPAPATAHMDQW